MLQQCCLLVWKAICCICRTVHNFIWGTFLSYRVVGKSNLLSECKFLTWLNINSRSSEMPIYKYIMIWYSSVKGLDEKFYMDNIVWLAKDDVQTITEMYINIPLQVVDLALEAIEASWVNEPRGQLALVLIVLLLDNLNINKIWNTYNNSQEPSSSNKPDNMHFLSNTDIKITDKSNKAVRWISNNSSCLKNMKSWRFLKP